MPDSPFQPAPAPPSVSVITATTGHRNLLKCIESVQRQDYARPVEHLLVVDGPQWKPAVDQVLNSLGSQAHLHVIRLPYPTGTNNWYGHRIYGGMPSLALTDFVCFLDDDNWFDPDHVTELIAAIGRGATQWGFSL